MSELRKLASDMIASYFGVKPGYEEIAKNIIDLAKQVPHTEANFDLFMHGVLDGFGIVDEEGLTYYKPASWLVHQSHADVWHNTSLPLRECTRNWFSNSASAQLFFDNLCTIVEPLRAVVAGVVQAEMAAEMASLHQRTAAGVFLSPLSMMKNRGLRPKMHWARKLMNWLQI